MLIYSLLNVQSNAAVSGLVHCIPFFIRSTVNGPIAVNQKSNNGRYECWSSLNSSRVGCVEEMDRMTTHMASIQSGKEEEKTPLPEANDKIFSQRDVETSHLDPA